MKINWMKYIFILIVALLIGLAVYIIYKDNKSKESGVDSKVAEARISPEINIGITGFDTINPFLSKNKDVQYLSKLIYRSLMRIAPDFKIQNDLAEEWSKLTDATYLIKLKNDIAWSDGSKFTAGDVKFTIDSVKNFQGDSIYKDNVKDIANVEIIDDYTIKIYLNNAVPFFEYMLSFPMLSANDYDGNTLESKTGSPVSMGDYTVSSISNDLIVLQKNENLTSLKKPDNPNSIKTININLYDSAAALYSNLKRGNIDFINTSNIDYETYIGIIGFSSSISPDREFDYIAVNTKNAVLSQKEVREAVNYAIDKQNIVQNIYNNKYLASNFPLDNGSYLYDKENQSYSADKVKSVLGSNGWVYKNSMWQKSNYTLNFNLIVEADNKNRVLAAQNIQQQLGAAGININVIQVSSGDYQNYIKNKNYDLLLTGDVMPLSPDLSSYFGADNLFNYDNAEIGSILGEVDDIQDAALLKEKYKRIAEIYDDELPFISLYFSPNISIASPDIKGVLDHNWNDVFYNINSWYKMSK
ncbi:MAG: ABC transporter substrate-binding protein [Firmicutes bacterium]|nr:ABC transporter substrate-binding protein [Bacillota bacterium]